MTKDTENKRVQNALLIQTTDPSDTPNILKVQDEAFGRPDVVELTRDLITDESCQPMVSLLARDGDKPVGHVLFTKARLVEADPSPSVYILAPLAVIPAYQKRGIGKALIEKGLSILKEMGVSLVFVLGHPTYYPRAGFVPAFPLGFSAPYPIPKKDEDAWMVQSLDPRGYGDVRGSVACAESMDSPEHWRE